VFLQKRVAFRSAETCAQRSPAHQQSEVSALRHAFSGEQGVSALQDAALDLIMACFQCLRLGGLTAHRSPLSRRLAAIKHKTTRTSHISAVSPSHLLSHSCFTSAALSTTGIPPPSAGKSVAPKHSQPISELRTIVNFGNFPTAHGCGFSETVLLQKFPKLTERYEPGFQCRVPAEVTAVVHRSSSDPGVLVVRLQPSHGTRSVSFHPF
jgi:hypothetical protein